MIQLLSYSFKFIIYVDFLAEAPKLKINSKSAYKTFIGGLISIILTIVSIIGIIYFGQELILKENPIAIQSIKDFQNVGPFHINNTFFDIYSSVQHQNFTYYNDPTIFRFEASQELILINDKGKQSLFSNKLEIKTCRDFYSVEELNKKIDIDEFYCIKPNTALIEGFWGNTKNQFLRIKLFKCTNSTLNNNHCKPKETINSYLSGGILGLYVKNSLLQIKDYANPIKYYNDDQYFSINLDFTFTLSFSLKTLVFQNDIGYLLQDVKEINGFYYETPKVLYYGKRDDLLAEIEIEGVPRGIVISRHYLKFQDVLTHIGGLIKAIMIIGNLIAKITSNIEFHLDYLFNLEKNNNLCERDSIINKFKVEGRQVAKVKASESLNQTRTPIKVIIQNKSSIINNIELHGQKIAKCYSLKDTNKNYTFLQKAIDYFNFVISYCKKNNISYAFLLKNKIDKIISVENIYERISIYDKIFDKITTQSDQDDIWKDFYISHFNK